MQGLEDNSLLVKRIYQQIKRKMHSILNQGRSKICRHKINCNNNMSNFLLTNLGKQVKSKMIMLLWHKVRKFHFQILKAIKIRIKNHISSNQSSRSPPRRKQLSKCPSLRRPATVCEMINSKQHPKPPTRTQSLASKTPPWTASHLC